MIASQVSAPSARKKILFIEDDPSVLASLELLLGEQYETFTAVTVAGGIRLFQEVQPELVLLDLNLPDRNGIEALREIRRLDATAPVIILTAYSTRAAAEESVRLGATDYFNKPFVAGDLTRRIEEITKTGRGVRIDSQIEQSVQESLEGFYDLKEFQNASAAFLHDVASPLSSLLVGVDLLERSTKEPQDVPGVEVTKVIELMSQSVAYLRALVEQWRSFSESQKLRQEKCDARAAIDVAVTQTSDEIHNAHVLLVVQHPKDKIMVPGNDFALARVLINLLRNAADAVPAMKGRIQITGTVTEKSYQLVVADNGSGISSEDMEKIFYPRFTTKGAGRGLGLFISKKLIEATGGKITVTSPGSLGGTDFALTFPLVSANA